MKKSVAILLGLILCLSLALPALVEEADAYTVGSIVRFGDYEQDNDEGNGEEPIEWIVLDVDGDRALLLSRYALDAQPYNTYTKRITWCRLLAAPLAELYLYQGSVHRAGTGADFELRDRQ